MQDVPLHRRQAGGNRLLALFALQRSGNRDQ